MEAVINYFSGILQPAQIVGYIALILAIISFQQNEPKRMAFFQLLANSMFVIHFAMIGAITGAVINLLSAIRSLVYSRRDKKWADHVAWTYAFVLAFVLTTIFFWEGAKSLLPMFGAICYTVSFRMKTAKLVRLVSLPSSPCWMIYNAINHSYAGILTETYVIVSIIIGMLRFDVKKRKKSDQCEL